MPNSTDYDYNYIYITEPSDIVSSSITFVKIILDFQPLLVDPNRIRNFIYLFNPIKLCKLLEEGLCKI